MLALIGMIFVAILGFVGLAYVVVIVGGVIRGIVDSVKGSRNPGSLRAIEREARRMGKSGATWEETKAMAARKAKA